MIRIPMAICDFCASKSSSISWLFFLMIFHPSTLQRISSRQQLFWVLPEGTWDPSVATFFGSDMSLEQPVPIAVITTKLSNICLQLLDYPNCLCASLIGTCVYIIVPRFSERHLWTVYTQPRAICGYVVRFEAYGLCKPLFFCFYTLLAVWWNCSFEEITCTYWRQHLVLQFWLVHFWLEMQGSLQFKTCCSE